MLVLNVDGFVVIVDCGSLSLDVEPGGITVEVLRAETFSFGFVSGCTSSSLSSRAAKLFEV